MNRRQLETLLAESGLPVDGADELAGVLGPLSGLAGQAPVPSAELAALFGADEGVGGSRRAVPRVARRPRGRGTVAGVVVLALSGVGATALSAAANTLPAPVQHQVSEFSHHYLPFDFPDPHPSVGQATDPRQAEGHAADSQRSDHRDRAEELSRSLSRSLGRSRAATDETAGGDHDRGRAGRSGELSVHSPPAKPDPALQQPVRMTRDDRTAGSSTTDDRPELDGKRGSGSQAESRDHDEEQSVATDPNADEGDSGESLPVDAPTVGAGTAAGTAPDPAPGTAPGEDSSSGGSSGGDPVDGSVPGADPGSQEKAGSRRPGDPLGWTAASD